VTFFTDALTKIAFKFFVNVKEFQVTILNGNVAGQMVDQMMNIQSWNGFKNVLSKIAFSL
jgi:hypothetical protein